MLHPRISIFRHAALGLAFCGVLGASAPFAPAVAADPLSGAVAGSPQTLPTETLVVHTRSGPHRLAVMVADTDQTREIGLMFRRQMGDQQGMIFDFPDPQPVSFWMRNTLIPLDIIFIDARGAVLNIAENARPLDETPLPSRGAARSVLEINGGLAARLGIRPGDRVTDEKIYRR